MAGPLPTATLVGHNSALMVVGSASEGFDALEAYAIFQLVTTLVAPMFDDMRDFRNAFICTFQLKLVQRKFFSTSFTEL